MVKKTIILRELKRLESLFNGATRAGDKELESFYAKLALIEVCGWVEETMDEIAARAKRRLKKQENINYLEKTIGENWGFHYSKNFKPMLASAVGIRNVEKLEGKVDSNRLQGLESRLANLKIERDEHSHVHIAGSIRVLPAPSLVRTHFEFMYTVLKELDQEIRVFC